MLTVSVMKTYALNQPLPSELVVADALDAYLTENGFNRNYDAPTLSVNFFGLRLNVPNPPSRKIAGRYHDLHHLVTGYGTDPAGEAEISAWETRRGITVFSPYIWMLVLTVFLMGLLHSPRAVSKAWKASKIGHRLPKPSIEHYESCLAMELGNLRTMYGLPKGGIAGARQLNLDAPKAVGGV